MMSTTTTMNAWITTKNKGIYLLKCEDECTPYIVANKADEVKGLKVEVNTEDWKNVSYFRTAEEAREEYHNRLR